MLQAEDKRQEAATELAGREQALADARTKVERLQRDKAGDRPQPATPERAPDEQALADARKRVEPVQDDEAGGHSLLIVGCALAALAGIGLITGAMLALTVDTDHVTTAGVIGAISGGAMLAVGWVAVVANWYRKHSVPVQDETPAASNGSRSTSKSTPRRTP
jgi:hypothetical protein